MKQDTKQKDIPAKHYLSKDGILKAALRLQYKFKRLN